MPAELATPSWIPAYLDARKREGRLYPDAIVELLPNVPAGHPLEQEWRQRADSSDRLLAHLRRHHGPLRVVDLGSGNGWLANRVAGLPSSEVVGLEANEVELAQSQRVFSGRRELRFVAGDMLTAPAPLDAPDAVILASVIQYVADLRGLLERLLRWLAPGGEVHLLDSPLYRPDEVAAARERTKRYYAELGVPQMADAYHHHAWAALDGFKAEVPYRPGAVLPRLERCVMGHARSPFPWVRIQP